MLLSFQPLEDVASVNQFRRVDAWRLNQGDLPLLYFQLVDASRGGFRYVPASGSLLQVDIHNIDDAFKIMRIATQPFPLQDPSIWALQLLPTDTCLGAPDILLTLTEYSSPGLAAATGDLTLVAVSNGITLTASGGATFSAPPAAGTTLVIGVDSDLYTASNGANGGFYTVTGTSSSTTITATKVSDLFYGALTAPQSVGVSPVLAVTNAGDIRVGPAIQTHSGLVQGKLRAQLMGQYAVPYRSPYTDNNNTNQTGFDG